MAARYDLYENPDPQKSGEKQPMHARFVPISKLTTEMLCKQAAYGSTFKYQELGSALELIIDTAIRELKSGNSVELGELGTLSLSLECRSVKNKAEIRSASVRAKNITLRPGKRIKKQLSNTEFERNPSSWKSSELETEIRDRKLTEYFAEHTFMFSRDYQQLRVCKPGKALKELNDLIREGRILRQGARSSSFYIPAKGHFGK